MRWVCERERFCSVCLPQCFCRYYYYYTNELFAAAVASRFFFLCVELQKKETFDDDDDYGGKEKKKKKKENGGERERRGERPTGCFIAPRACSSYTKNHTHTHTHIYLRVFSTFSLSLFSPFLSSSHFSLISCLWTTDTHTQYSSTYPLTYPI